MSEHQFKIKHIPQINISCPSNGRMWLITGCAFLCVLQSSMSDNGRSLIIALVSVFSAVLTEILLTRRRHGAAKIKDGSAVATAMLLTILLPNLIHPVYAALGTAFAIIVIKYSFGGLGSNWLNPALGGWLFIRFSWPAAFKNALENTAFTVADMNITSTVKADDNITSFLNDTIFSLAGMQMPSGYISLLFSSGPGIITDRGLFALLAGTVIITAFGINRGWVPLVFLSVYAFLIRLAGDLSGEYWNGDMLYGLFSGGTIAAAFILAAEPASSAKLKAGIILALIMGAVLSWFFRYRCLEYSGCFIALVIVNCFTPLIRSVEDKFILSRTNKIKIPENII